MKCSLLEQGLATPRAHAPLDRRYAERAPLDHEVTYSRTEGARITTSTGTLQDLSKTGCKILGSTAPALGLSVTFTLNLDDGQAPLRLTEATVTWMKGNLFALRFPTLTENDRKRIQAVIWKHVSLSNGKSYRTAFRIVP